MTKLTPKVFCLVNRLILAILFPKDALVIKALRSPHAQARIKSIDTSKAKLIPGVEAIFTYEDVPNTRFTLAGQTYPEPSAYDALILDPVVRYVWRRSSSYRSKR